MRGWGEWPRCSVDNPFITYLNISLRDHSSSFNFLFLDLNFLQTSLMKRGSYFCINNFWFLSLSSLSLHQSNPICFPFFSWIHDRIVSFSFPELWQFFSPPFILFHFWKEKRCTSAQFTILGWKPTGIVFYNHIKVD